MWQITRGYCIYNLQLDEDDTPKIPRFSKLGTAGDHAFVHGIFFCNLASIAEFGRLPLLPHWRTSEMIKIMWNCRSFRVYLFLVTLYIFKQYNSGVPLGVPRGSELWLTGQGGLVLLTVMSLVDTSGSIFAFSSSDVGMFPNPPKPSKTFEANGILLEFMAKTWIQLTVDEETLGIGKVLSH